MKESKNREVGKIWVTGKSSLTIVIPKRFANDLGFAASNHIVIEKNSDSLIIRKLEDRD